ncbi:MAG: hypothetical protein II309_03410 [Bacilli bacterium]|jgi:hypothetical protein|nr:hypothetical protein [Bacilli bacterium]
MEELRNELNKIKYGWYDNSGKLHKHIDKDYMLKYRMQTSEEMINHGYGVCWETVELEREYFEKNNIPCKSYFIVIAKFRRYECHTFLVYEENNKYYWFEHSWDKLKGVYEFDNLDELLDKVILEFPDIVKYKNYNPNDLEIYEYKKPKEHINCLGFYAHCFKSKKIR